MTKFAPHLREAMLKPLKLFSSVAMLAVCAACSISQGWDEDVFSSIAYDEVACAELLGQRDRLAMRHGIPSDYRRGEGDAPPPAILSGGFGAFVPDLRGSPRREVDRARGVISAMNGSITRRGCDS
jgi:hypothetical protein